MEWVSLHFIYLNYFIIFSSFEFVAAKSGQISCVASSTGMLPGYLTGNVALKYEYRGLSRCYLPLLTRREDGLFRVHEELYYLHVFTHLLSSLPETWSHH